MAHETIWYVSALKGDKIGGMSKQERTKRRRERTPNNRTMTGYRISDELWAVLQPLLPVHVNTHRFGGERPRVPDRVCADAIFYVLRTGCQWQALDFLYSYFSLTCTGQIPKPINLAGRARITGRRIRNRRAGEMVNG